MTDERLRDLERRYRQTGAKNDENAYEAEGLRSGTLIETGFIQRLEERGEDYRSRVRVYLADGSRDVSLSRLFPRLWRGVAHMVMDVEFADGRVNVLTYGHFNSERGFEKHLISISADGGVETLNLTSAREGESRPVSSLLNIKGRLGFVCSGSVTSRVYVGSDLVHVTKKDIFDSTGSEGFLYYDRLRRVYIVSSEAGGVRECFEPARPRNASRGVYVREGRVVAGVNLNSSYRIRSECRENNFAGLPIPESSRLLQKKFVAPANEELERYYNARPLGIVRTIREVPKRNLEGLLIAVERASHKKRGKK